MKSKIISAILLTSLLCGLISCGSSENDTETTSSESTKADTTAESGPLPELPDADYDGYTFTFYMREGNTDMYAEELDGDTMNDAIYERNMAVADRFNIEYALVTDTSNGTLAKDTILAGDDAYDVIIPHARYAFSYAQAGLVLDWNTGLEYVDLDQPWWAADARESFTILGKLYCMIGDISYQNLGATKVMFFNKNMFDTYDWEYPYQTVRDGDWTFERFSELATAAYMDLNGDTIYDFETDQSGFATSWWGTPINILFTADQRICEKNEDGELELTLNSEKTVEVFEKFFALMQNDGCYIHMNDDSTPIIDRFIDGRLMFIETTLSTFENLREMEDDFGIIPCPKFDETVDRYITGVDATCNLLVVPITASDPARTSAILEALAYEGWKNVMPTYYDVVLTSKYARDEDSVEMLDIIRESRIYDIGYFYSPDDFPMAMSSIGWQLCKTADHSFASYYAQNEAAGKAALDKINEYYRGE